MFQQTNEGICFKMKVIPRASRSQLIGWENGELKMRLMAIPEKGQANQELLEFLATILNINRSQIILKSGEKGRHKCVCISKLSIKQIQEKLQQALISNK